MRAIILVVLLALSPCWGQQPAPSSQAPEQAPPAPTQAPPSVPAQPAPQSPAAAPATAQPQTLTVPAGTHVLLSMVSAIMSRSSRPGAPIRAVTVFPFTTNNQVTIPVGTYVEGVVEKLDWRTPRVQLHFTRMVFANGYTVPLDAANVVALDRVPSASPVAGFELASFSDDTQPHFVLAAQQQSPTLPPLPHQGPPAGFIAGVAAAGAVAIVVTVLAIRHYHSVDWVVYPPGWQFDMVLESPLTLDAASVAAAAAIPAPVTYGP